MDSYSGIIICFWRHGNIFIYELSVSSTKVTASCKNWKTLMTKTGALNFLLLLVDIVFTAANVYQKLFILQVIFQRIIKLFWRLLTKICSFSVENCVLNSLTNLVRFKWTLIFLLSIENLKRWTHFHLPYPI